MIKYVVKHNKPEILVITPLFTGHKIGKETKKTLKRNKTPFEWISYMDSSNPCKNAQVAFDIYRKNNDLPPYIIKIDNDLITQRGMLDEMFNVLEQSMSHEAYCYCPFEFQGAVNVKFKNDFPFDPDHLRKENYISSCSMMKTKKFLEIGMWVTNDEGFRLLDWALWLKYLNRGYVGVPTTKTSFVAIAGNKSVSSGGYDDYQKKRQWVLDNFG